jgi:hypothetical protein
LDSRIILLARNIVEDASAILSLKIYFANAVVLYVCKHYRDCKWKSSLFLFHNRDTPLLGVALFEGLLTAK